ncbi:MlaD family protein [Pseudomonadales bacterium]|nr:MlaD family protein [Pseudomonadales bacterium]
MKATATGPLEITARDRIIGFFVFGALLIMLVLFLSPLLQQLGDRDNVTFVTYLDKTYGIQQDARVNLNGVTIGSVSGVGLNAQGRVTVVISLSKQYERFYTSGSKLLIDSEIGVTSILNGIGLSFISGMDSNEKLKDGDELETSLETGFNSILDSLDVGLVVSQLTNIVQSTEDITTGFSENQASLYLMVSNLQSVTAQLDAVSQSLPKLLMTIEQSAISFDATAQGAQRIIEKSEDDLVAAVKNAASLTAQATATLKKTERLIEAGDPIAESLPELIRKTELALGSVDELAQTLNRSWLFGGRKKLPRSGEESGNPAD